MSLFAHYPADAAAVLSQAESLRGAAGRAEGVGSSVSGRTKAAATQTDGLLESPVAELDRPVTVDVDGLSSAGLVAGGALGLFSSAITTYDEGVDELNRIYDEAKAANFHAEPIADDATGADGKPLSDSERQSAFDGRIDGARSELVATLRTSEAALMRTLDQAADGTAGLLGAQPGSPVFQAALTLFGGTGATSPFAGVSATGSATTSDSGGGFGAFVGGIGGGLTDLSGGLLGLGEEVWDRGSTLGVYAWDTGVRRITNPTQTLWDFATKTALLEDLAAVEGIVVEDGELYRDGPFAGEATYLTGVSVPPGSDAITLGHTVRFGDEGAPEDDLAAHETQHVYDLEDVGGLGFYGSYAGEYVANLLGGDSSDEAYENISWEERAYEISDNYPGQLPEGIGGPVSDVIDWADGLVDW